MTEKNPLLYLKTQEQAFDGNRLNLNIHALGHLNKIENFLIYLILSGNNLLIGCYL